MGTNEDVEVQSSSCKHVPRYVSLLLMLLVLAVVLAASAFAISIFILLNYQHNSFRDIVHKPNATTDGNALRRPLLSKGGQDISAHALQDSSDMPATTKTAPSRRNRQVWGKEAGNCSKWKELCEVHLTSIHHGHHTIGARVRLDPSSANNRQSVNRITPLIWTNEAAYKSTECIAQCAGLTENKKYIEVAKHGIYTVRVRLQTKPVDTRKAKKLLLDIGVSRKNSERRIFPNTGGKVNLYHERLFILNPNDRIYVKAHYTCKHPRFTHDTSCGVPLTTDITNALEMFRV